MAAKTLHFSVRIRAPRPLVWETMLGAGTYPVWTSVFAEGSHYDGSWNTGDAIRFLADDGGGMASIIAESRPPEYVSIKHVGEVTFGVVDTTSERVRAWAPAFETYTLVSLPGTEAGAVTEVAVDLDISPEHEGYMQQTWPLALARLRQICEADG